MRMGDLLREAADTLDGQEHPFTPAWLGAHDVTLDECVSLAELLAVGARTVAYGLEHPRTHEGQAMMMTLAREASS